MFRIRLLKTEVPKNPVENAGLLSRLMFLWVFKILINGRKRTLDEDDIVEVLHEDKANGLGNELENAWKKESEKLKPSFFRALYTVFGRTLMVYGFITVLLELVFKAIQTLSLGRLLYYYTPGQTDVSHVEACLYAGIITSCALANVLFGHNYMIGLEHLGLKIKVACCSLIYRKSLKISKVALSDTTSGQIINLLSTDVDKLNYAPMNFHNLWVAPLQTLFIMYLVYRQIGWTGIVGVCFIILFFPLQIYLGKRSSALRLKTALRTDDRIKFMNEMITGIQVIKMYSWENAFAKLIETSRKLEIDQIKAIAYIRGSVISFTNFLGNFALFLSILAYVLTGNSVHAEYVFVLSSFYNILRLSMTSYLPRGIAQCAEAVVSIRRLEKFLLLEDRKTAFAEKLTKNEIAVKLENVNVKLIKSTTDFTLKDVSVEIRKNELAAVIGYVGSGKSSLLQVMLNEVPLVSGSLAVKGSISYVSQEAWIFGGTIRDNILFGECYDVERYQKVIEVCALERDVSLFPLKDLTVVGERGITLSGGQKARINLARAVYKDANIYLFDDPLSAVDSYVAKQIFDGCISNFLKEKCVILVTNQLQFLRTVDKIIFLEKGTIAKCCTYNDLHQSNFDFVKLLKSEDYLDESAKTENKTYKEEYKKNDIEQVQEKEFRNEGSIGNDVYSSYFKAGGAQLMIAIVILLFCVAQISVSGSDYFLTYWTNIEQIRASRNISESLDINYISREVTLSIYAILIISTVIFFLARSIVFFVFCMRASINLHNRMFNKIIRTPIRFFQQNSSGRILNRFSKDIAAIDETIPLITADVLQIGFTILGIMIITAIINTRLIPASIAIIILFYFLKYYYLATSRSLKRLEGITRSPVFTHINTSLQGLTTIRAFNAEDMVKKEFDDYQDIHSSAWFLFMGTSRGFGFWLDLMCVIYIGLVIFSFLLIGKEQYGGNVGLVITQSIMITAMFQWGIRQWGELENQMTSVERVVEYTTLETEEDEEIQKLSPPIDWPMNGCIEFRNVNMRYSLLDPYALKNINFTINPQEKVGIVGRTGAGKSSLVTALFQLTAIEGQILTDDWDISKFPVAITRSRFSIIPQDPVLFSGSLRKNLDPFDEYPDHELWHALDAVEMRRVVNEMPSTINSKVSEGGTNFSVGQRQLLCLARAIIRKNKILVLDEATANVDPKTDELIQETIRKKFISCTVLTIAHRLNTVIDSDRILVVDNGEVKEFDHPYILLRSEGIFHGMVQQLGGVMANNLYTIAQKNHMSSV